MARPVRWVGAVLLLGIVAIGVTLLVLQHKGITPRALAPYVEKRSSGHNQLIVDTGRWGADTLVRLDRGRPAATNALFTSVGARAKAVPGPVGGTVRLVATSDEARQAITYAQPGDVIILVPGVYRFDRVVAASRAGTEQANIVVRAEQPGTVTVEMEMGEGFSVSAPHWRFENLTIKGTCRVPAFCEHAFHVAGAASHFKSINNTIVDFNAHFKINGSGGRYPDHGRIENNTLTNDSVRATNNPVTPVDLVAASHWRIRRNLITDFIKGAGDRISYGGFAKGGGADNVFEQNAVLCEAKLQGAAGQRVGLSLGGGGTGKDYCRGKRCIVEQEKSEIRANLIAACSDDGIYLNNAAASKIVHNTIIDTGGIQARYAGTSADIEGNLIDGEVRSKNGAELRLHDNKTTAIALLYLGYHPVRSLFRNPAAFDFAWSGAPPQRTNATQFVPDLCGAKRDATPAYGAFEDIAACAVQKD